MKKKFLFPVIFFIGLMLNGFSVNLVNGQITQSKQVNDQKVQYTCPQHAEVVQDKPGKCPKCGMTLVEKKEMTKGDITQKCDTTKMNSGNMKIKCDSTSMKHDKMKM